MRMSSIRRLSSQGIGRSGSAEAQGNEEKGKMEKRKGVRITEKGKSERQKEKAKQKREKKNKAGGKNG